MKKIKSVCLDSDLIVAIQAMGEKRDRSFSYMLCQLLRASIELDGIMKTKVGTRKGHQRGH